VVWLSNMVYHTGVLYHIVCCAMVYRWLLKWPRAVLYMVHLRYAKASHAATYRFHIYKVGDEWIRNSRSE